MAAAVGRGWEWIRSWGSCDLVENATDVIDETKKHGSSDKVLRGWASWIWGGWRHHSDHSSSIEEYWEAQEKLPPMNIEDLSAGKEETEADSAPTWWKYLTTSFLPWTRKTEVSRRRRRLCNVWSADVLDRDVDGEFSDYGTPPPSPTLPPSQLTSPFRVFAHSWKVEIQPEHHEICFNFLRHLFDLIVVGFLWIVSPPAKMVLEVLGIQGALKLWFHGMAMFFVSTVGMAGLLWLIQEYLPQFALIYGIIQALVISVSVRQSVILSIEEEKQNEDEEGKETDEIKDSSRERKEQLVSEKDKMKTS